VGLKVHIKNDKWILSNDEKLINVRDIVVFISDVTRFYIFYSRELSNEDMLYTCIFWIACLWDKLL